MSRLELAGVHFAYRDKPVLREVGLSIAAGELLAIVGPNGAGKSTLLKIMSGALRAGGSVRYGERDLAAWEPAALARELAIAPQAVTFHFPFTVGQYVLLARHPHQGWSPFESADDLAIAHAALAQAGIAHLTERNVLELSGGEKQLTIIAAALAQTPRLLLLDEPTAALDLRHQIDVFEVLKTQNAQANLTVVIVTHDLNLAARYCPRMILLHDGRIVADGAPAEILQAERIAAAYGTPVEAGRRADGQTPYLLPLGRS